MRTLSIGVFVCVVATAVAQRAEPGYLVLKEGGKKEGMIGYNPVGSKKNLITISEHGGPQQTFSAEQLSEFYLNAHDARFLSVLDTVKSEHFFAEIVLEGNMTLARVHELYVLRKADGSSFNVQFPMLITSDTDVGQEMIKRSRFLYKLSAFLDDCVPPNEIPQKLKSDDLEVLVKRYNTCTKSTSVEKGKTSVRFGVIAGFHSTTLKASPASSDVFEGNSGYRAGVEIDVIPGPYHRRPNLNIQLLYNTSNIDFVNNPNSPPPSLNYKSIRIPISVKLYFRNGHAGPFVQPGLIPSINFASSSKAPVLALYKRYFMGMFGAGWTHALASGNTISGSLRVERIMGGFPFNYPVERPNYQMDVAFMVAFSF